jgi:hypothetical protein
MAVFPLYKMHGHIPLRRKQRKMYTEIRDESVGNEGEVK